MSHNKGEDGNRLAPEPSAAVRSELEYYLGRQSKSGTATRLPRGFPVGVGEPLNGWNHAFNGMGEMIEIDVGKIVGGLMVVGSKAVTGDGLGDNTLAGKLEIVRTPEESLGRMGIGDKRCSVVSEGRTKIGTLPSGEP